MDNYLEKGRINSSTDFLTRDLRRSSPALRQRKDDLYLSGYGRQWGEGLTYSAGVAYSTGMMLGGSYGVLAGLKKGGATPRLFANTMLNSCAAHGPALANRCAVTTMFYCGLSSLLGLVKDADSSLNAAVAGGLSGALYKLSGSWRARSVYSLSSAAIFVGIDAAFRHGYI